MQKDGTLQIFLARGKDTIAAHIPPPCSSLHINPFQIDLIYMFNMLFYVRSLSWVSVCECLTLFWSSGRAGPLGEGRIYHQRSRKLFSVWLFAFFLLPSMFAPSIAFFHVVILFRCKSQLQYYFWRRRVSQSILSIIWLRHHYHIYHCIKGRLQARAIELCSGLQSNAV